MNINNINKISNSNENSSSLMNDSIKNRGYLLGNLIKNKTYNKDNSKINHLIEQKFPQNNTFKQGNKVQFSSNHSIFMEENTSFTAQEKVEIYNLIKIFQDFKQSSIEEKNYKNPVPEELKDTLKFKFKMKNGDFRETNLKELSKNNEMQREYQDSDRIRVGFRLKNNKEFYLEENDEINKELILFFKTYVAYNFKNSQLLVNTGIEPEIIVREQTVTASKAPTETKIKPRMIDIVYTNGKLSNKTSALLKELEIRLFREELMEEKDKVKTEKLHEKLKIAVYKQKYKEDVKNAEINQSEVKKNIKNA